MTYIQVHIPGCIKKERRPAWAASCVGKEELLMLSVSFQLKLDTNPEMPAQWQYWLDCIVQQLKQMSAWSAGPSTACNVSIPTACVQQDMGGRGSFTIWT
jgi:hypothetical protein